MIKFPIDFVLPYVNNYDPIWQTNYKKYCIASGNKNRLDAISGERYRDFGWLVYLFRGIDKYMPFIRKVYFIVSNIEQVPTWIDQEKVQVVLHKDFIPEQYLPTYNSTTIEMFIPDIKGLSEHFIYGNDDIFPMAPTTAEDYFTEDGNPKISFGWAKLKPNTEQFWKVCHKMYIDLVTALKVEKGEEGSFLVPTHSLTPITKKQAKAARKVLKETLPKLITNFRSDTNYNQYIYSEYAYLSGVIPIDGSQRTVKYMALDKKKISAIMSAINETGTQELILNDTEKTIFSYWHAMQHHINRCFINKFPNKSKYEKMNGAIK